MALESRKLPVIDRTECIVDQSGYRVEQQDLIFANGERRQFRRMLSAGRGAVLAIPVTENNEVLLIREYCAGSAKYEWSLPKGHIESGESFTKAAIRESREETGYGAGKATFLKSVSLSPSYMTHMTHLVLLEELYEAPLSGDEPEIIDVQPFPLADIINLTEWEDFTEARSLFALFYVQALLKKRNQ